VAHPTTALRADHVASFRAALALRPDAALADLLGADALAEHLPGDGAALYHPLLTLRLWLNQVLDADRSCRQAVCRLAAERAADAQPAPSAATGGYCKARRRLPEAGLHRLAVAAGQALHRRAKAAWRWRGRRVLVADGTTVTLPDTPANRRDYPQPDWQKPGLGFPMVRLVGLFCLATGALLDLAVAPYAGKGTGELALWRALWHHLREGDVLLADRAFCSWPEMAVLLARGVDVVLTKNASRKTDFRTGRRLGPRDHVVRWPKPKQRPEWLGAAAWAALPAALEVRELEVLRRRGKRRAVVAATSLTDAAAWPRGQLKEVHKQRWEGEVDLRSVKATLGMGELRCKSPAMARKELWVYLLGYNLLRGRLAQVAHEAGVAPRQLSVAAARQAWEAFAEAVRRPGPGREGLWQRLRAVMEAHQVGNRPGRAEPRAKKRRKKNYPVLTVPRDQARRRLRRAS
jgi:Transposase DDE domain